MPTSTSAGLGGRRLDAGPEPALGERRRLAGEGHRRQRLADGVEEPVEQALARSERPD